LHRPSVALEVLDRCLAAAHETPATGGFMWAQYQRGVISRTSAEDLLAHSGWQLTEPIARLLQQAEDDLKQVRRRGGVEWKISADHHLGVIEMLRGNHERALGTFQDCLRHREQNKATCSEAHCAPHRQAFEHRRIAQCHARIAADATKAQRQKELACAAHHFTQARQLASAANHARLLYELDRDVQAWGIEQKANHHAH
jgi:hypothetical protein